MIPDDDPFRPKLKDLAYTKEGKSYPIVEIIRRKGDGQYDVVIRVAEEFAQHAVVKQVGNKWTILSNIHYKNIYK